MTPTKVLPDEIPSEDLLSFLVENPYAPIYTVFKDEVVYKFIYMSGDVVQLTNYLLPDPVVNTDPMVIDVKLNVLKKDGPKYFDVNDKFYTLHGIKKILDSICPEPTV